MSKEIKITEPVIDLKNNRVFYDSIIDLNHKLDSERSFLVSDIRKLIERKDITNESLRKGKVSKRLRQYEKFIIKVNEDYKRYKRPF